MLKLVFLGFGALIALATPALAEPPADLEACIKLTNRTIKEANIKTEADYVKFNSKKLDLYSACGTRDLTGAEKIANDIKAQFPSDK